jgi:hypothetical protein
MNNATTNQGSEDEDYALDKDGDECAAVESEDEIVDQRNSAA